MSATLSLLERNGPIPGKLTDNVNNTNWKSVDDTTTPYTSYLSLINLGTNSYTKYHCIRFSGQFTTLGNVTMTHLSGVLPNGIKLMSSPSITLDSQKLPYNQPTRTINTGITPTNITAVSSSVNLLIGPANSADPATSTNKLNIADNTGTPLYTNYFVTQLQVAKNAETGSIGSIVIQISYDEV